MSLLKYIIAVILFLVSPTLMAQPDSFMTKNNQKAVWTDSKLAHYEINYDITAKTAYAVSTIDFVITEAGFPVLDFVETASEISINSKSTTAIEIQVPNGESKVKLIETLLDVGAHTVIITTPITAGLKFKNNTVENLFLIWI